ncbi:exonuclease domain-containing protein [Corynebacterium sp. ES2794-CONJ1]|uniref:exonuclease domain-containing protein n=1 Tax=unclassified Corynebacterium TaxID=2624378 RepID=UPI0021676CCB|nr:MULTISPECIES: exonuclease domain-containing protein [unclassified Corynebacterium]MCS4489799.1 exonuclease domain-containing protein [Corynebacterium sp. ES2775-CONJ]MCS4491837.1 exonuclease domain-containing protein [Corynebacterium sp. ES2715-CONJ3]MCS4531942.1 exonuclease domain-containing protein [Corynebacterium sp. ES2730-CONJ]MCU9519343.1 exonuclease domain-containing protein [Corynebacterium sp. ES2794-CONJ1]
MDALLHPFDPQKVISFDLETTSAQPFEARIVTSALITIDTDGAHPYEMLADPGVDIPEEATNVHGISTDYARTHGRPHNDVLNETIATITKGWEQGYTLIVFNAAYDLSVLHHLDPSFLINGPVFDPYVIDKTLDRYRKGRRTLTDLCEFYGVKIDNAHEATADALAAARIAWKQAKHTFKTDISDRSMEELMEFQAVGYHEIQSSLARYLQGEGKDADEVNTSWPVQVRRAHT